MQKNYKQNTNHRKKVEHLYLNRILISTKQNERAHKVIWDAWGKKENYLSGLS